MTTETRMKVYVYVEVGRDRRERIEFDTRHVTGGQIKEMAGVPSDFELARVEGHRRVAVPDDQSIEIKEGEHFIAVPSGRVS